MNGQLPAFPVDDETLDLLETAIDPDRLSVGAECSSLNAFLEFMSELAGSTPEGQQEVELEDGVAVYPDPSYHHNEVIKALIDEVRRLRTAAAP